MVVHVLPKLLVTKPEYVTEFITTDAPTTAYCPVSEIAIPHVLLPLFAPKVVKL